MTDITALIEQGKKLAEAATPEVGWYVRRSACFSGMPDYDRAYIAHHSPATMLRLYAEIAAKDAEIARLRAVSSQPAEHASTRSRTATRILAWIANTPMPANGRLAMNDEMIKRPGRITVTVFAEDGQLGDVEFWEWEGEEAIKKALSALTPADLEALLAEKLPGWVIVPEVWTPALDEVLYNYGVNDGPTCWEELISARPKPGEV